MTKKTLDDLLNYIAKERKIRYTKEDVSIFLDGFVEYLEECVANGDELKIRGLGKLYYVPIPERTIKSFTDKTGKYHPEKVLPPTIKVNFRLAENIRNLAK